MTIFYSRSETDKKLRYLYQENKMLRAKLAELTGENEQLKQYTAQQLSQIKNQEEALAAKEIAITSCEAAIDGMQEEQQTLRATLEEMRKEQQSLRDTLEACQPALTEPPKGPGRKAKASPEDIQTIQNLRLAGYSYAQIAAHLAEATGKHWSKSSVYDTVRRLKQPD